MVTPQPVSIDIASRPKRDWEAHHCAAGVKFHMDLKYATRNLRTATARATPAPMNTKGNPLSTPPTTVGCAPPAKRLPPNAAPMPSSVVGALTDPPQPPPATMVGPSWPLDGTTKLSIFTLYAVVSPTPTRNHTSLWNPTPRL